MNRFLGLIGILALLVTSLAFAYLNSGHRVTLRLGVATLYGVPLTVVVFGSVIAGMVVMLVAGIRSDLKVRRILRARLAEEDREERERFVDLSQQDLFEQEGGVAGGIASPTGKTARRPQAETELSPRPETAPEPGIEAEPSPPAETAPSAPAETGSSVRQEAAPGHRPNGDAESSVDRHQRGDAV